MPDVFVRPAPGGGWTVELNEAALPRLIVDRVYFAHVSARASGDADKRYLTDCLQKASWLEKSLDQRARTVLKVASEIVRHQEGFLADGVAMLRPLNLRMVADAIGIHESTVSRAAANKTIATPRGIFEFRYFFTGAIAATSGGEAHSAEAVKHRIRRMIMEEAPDAVLSDDAIVAAFARGHRDRPPHGRQISRDHAHRLLRRAPPRAAARRLLKISRLHLRLPRLGLTCAPEGPTGPPRTAARPSEARLSATRT